jgi:hypothetical protein
MQTGNMLALNDLLIAHRGLPRHGWQHEHDPHPAARRHRLARTLSQLSPQKQASTSGPPAAHRNPLHWAATGDDVPILDDVAFSQWNAARRPLESGVDA